MRVSKVHASNDKDAHAAMLRRLLQRDTAPAHFVSRQDDTMLFAPRKDATIDPEITPTRPGRSFLLALRILGCLPLSVMNDGKVIFKFFSPVTAYSIVVYALILTTTYFEINRRVMFTGKLDTTVDSLMYIVFFLKNVFIPVIMWMPIHRVANHQMAWIAFHENYIRVTGQPLQFIKLQKYSPYIAVAIPGVAVVLISLWIVKFAPQEPWLMLIYCVPVITSLSLDGLWCTSYITIGMAAARINTQLKQHLNRYQGEDSVQEVLVREYRALYLEVSRLLQSNNDVSTVTFTYHTLHVFLMLTLSLYAVLSGLRNEWDWAQSLKLIGTILFLIELWTLANAAHFTTVKFEEIQWDEDWLIPAATMPDGVRKEITTLLEVAAASPRVVDIGGFVTINRSWLTNMLGNLLSSLIILLQFRVSQTDESGVSTIASTTVSA